jgi:hypothetical protein
MGSHGLTVRTSAGLSPKDGKKIKKLKNYFFCFFCFFCLPFTVKRRQPRGALRGCLHKKIIKNN